MNLIICTAIIVLAVALAAWLLHKKITAEGVKLSVQANSIFNLIGKDIDAISRESQTIAEAVHAKLDASERSLRAHVVDEIDGLQSHVTAETDRAATSLRSHALDTVHEVIGTVQRVNHAVCSVCGKLSHSWEFIEGKVVCLDCKIRSTPSS